MTNQLKLLLISGFAVAVIGILVLDQINQGEEYSALIPSGQVSRLSLPKPSGNVDAAIKAFLQDGATEQPLFEQELKDADLLGSDGQALSDFGRSYDQNEF